MPAPPKQLFVCRFIYLSIVKSWSSRRTTSWKEDFLVGPTEAFGLISNVTCSTQHEQTCTLCWIDWIWPGSSKSAR
jgi:hypothetical protein